MEVLIYKQPLDQRYREMQVATHTHESPKELGWLARRMNSVTYNNVKFICTGRAVPHTSSFLSKIKIYRTTGPSNIQIKFDTRATVLYSTDDITIQTDIKDNFLSSFLNQRHPGLCVWVCACYFSIIFVYILDYTDKNYSVVK